MPSPIGHSLAGLCGYMVARNNVDPPCRGWFLCGTVTLANLADLDFLAGLLLGDLSAYHHQATHSLLAVAVVILLVGFVAGGRKLNEIGWGLWAGGLYLSHIILDMLVNDPSPPFGVQLLWPFSQAYYIAPITPFARFDYIDPAAGILAAVLSTHNLGTVQRELILVSPLIAVTWLLGKFCGRGYLQNRTSQPAEVPRSTPQRT